MSWEILGGAALGGLGSILNNERNLAFQKDAQDWNIGAQGRPGSVKTTPCSGVSMTSVWRDSPHIGCRISGASW